MLGVAEQQECGMTVSEALSAVEADLRQIGSESPRVAAEWVLADVLGIRRLELAMHGDAACTEAQAVRLKELRSRLRTYEPIQYVLGETEFMGLSIRCDARALIPRPETERLVDLALHDALWERSEAVRVIDVGTGSGCVALTVAHLRKQADVLAIDVSEQALELARENAIRLQLAERVRFCQNDLLENLLPDSVDLVIANLPYIDRGTCAVLPPDVRLHEPLSALDGGEQGLDLIGKLIQQGQQVLSPGGALYLEIGADQGGCVREGLHAHGYQQIEIFPDWAGRDRVAKGVKP